MHVSRTTTSVLHRVKKLQDMEHDNGPPMNFFFCLTGTQRKEELFCLVRTMGTDRNCTDVQLADRCDLATLAAQIYSRHPEWLPSTGPSSLDRLRPQNYKGSVRVCGVDVPQIVRGAVKEAVALLSCHPWFTNSAEKFAAWEKEGIDTLEPNGEPLVIDDEVDPDDDEAAASVDAGEEEFRSIGPDRGRNGDPPCNRRSSRDSSR